MKSLALKSIVLTLATALSCQAGAAWAQTEILNVSYDVSRELYKDVNQAFAASYEKASGEKVTIKQSHGGSTKQARAVIDGLEADVVTMNQPPDIDILAKTGGLVAADWRKKFPHEATPYATTSVFLVRKGNPKNLKNWEDLAKPGIQVIVPNPKTSGNGRYTYLAAWGYKKSTGGSEEAARKFVGALFANVPVLDGGGRGATTTFTQRDIGDVLVTFENEALLIAAELGSDKFDVVYPAISIDASAPIAVVDKVVDKRGTRKIAEAYLNFLYTPDGQRLIAKHGFRPRNAAVAKENAGKFPDVKTFTVAGVFGSWAEAQKKHFAEGGIYDEIAKTQAVLTQSN